MNRDDHLFAIIGGTVVTAAAGVFLGFAGGISGSIDAGPTLRVTPIRAAESPVEEDVAAPPQAEAAPVKAAGVVPAAFNPEEPGMGDDLIGAIATGLSAHPKWASWLVTDDLLHRFVEAVEAVADGYSPADQLGFMAAKGAFLVREDEGRLVIAAGTYRRYSLAVEVLSSIDAERAVAVFRELEPEIEAIRRDMAWHRGDFEDRLRLAVDHLLAVEVPHGPMEVERRTASYAFAADEHELLSGAQRQLLRMGRSNALAVQTKLQDLHAAFGWLETPAVLAAPMLIAEVPAVEESITIAEEAIFVEPMLSLYDPRVMGFPMAPPAAPVAP